MTESAPVAAIIGASGYGGAELVRLLLRHPSFVLGSMCAHRRAGEEIAKVIPSLRGVVEGEFQPIRPETLECDVAFLALPHGASAPIAAILRERGKVVVDLSADFRLNDKAVYEEWYGSHGAPEHFGKAIYGLVEFHREALKTADLIAVPGCYPTASSLALGPLLAAGLVEAGGLVIDAKSGVSGAGRNPTPATHLPESAGGIRAYKPAGTHRHTPEIEQMLGELAGEPIRLTFTPHLVPMSRGILVTAYAMAKPGTTQEQCMAAAKERYGSSPVVDVIDDLPDTNWVRGSARAHVSYRVDARTGRVVAFCSIDNLLKGAAGQAVQAANVRFELGEGTALRDPGAWP